MIAYHCVIHVSYRNRRVTLAVVNQPTVYRSTLYIWTILFYCKHLSKGMHLICSSIMKTTYPLKLPLLFSLFLTKFILWNNRDKNIENKSVYQKTWRDNNVIFIQDMLNDHGIYLSPQEFSDKYDIKVNFLQYQKIISAIPTHLKSRASIDKDFGSLNPICDNFDSIRICLTWAVKQEN